MRADESGFLFYDASLKLLDATLSYAMDFNLGQQTEGVQL